MRLRPYSGWDDLPTLQRLVAAGTRDAPGRGYVHPSDVAWWVGWHPRRDLPDDAIVLADVDGQTAGWALDDDGDVREYVDPGLLDTPGAETFFSAIGGWIDARGDRRRTLVGRWADDDDAVAIARLEAEGYRRTDDGDWCFERDLRTVPTGAGDVRAVDDDDDVRARASVTFAAFDNPPPFDRYLAEYRSFVASPAYPRGWDLLCRTPEGAPASCCIAWPDPVSGVGSFEPVATRAEHVRRGFGRAVMAEGLRRLREAGMHTAIVHTSIGNEAANGLYRSLGFEHRRTWHVYSRPRPGDG
jgi:mycothiol synthase